MNMINLINNPDLLLASIDNELSGRNSFNQTPKVLVINYNDWQRVLSIIKDLRGDAYLRMWDEFKYYNGMKIRRSEDVNEGIFEIY